MFSRAVLVKVLIWHLPQHELPPSEGLWGGPRRSLEHHGASGGALGGSLGVPWRSPRAPGILRGFPGVPGGSLGSLGGPRGSLKPLGGDPGVPWSLGGSLGYLGGIWGGSWECLGEH